METNKTINRIRFAHWKKSSQAPCAKALGFSRYCKRYKTREDMSLPREQLAKVRTPFRVLSGFIFVLSLFAILATVTFAFAEPYDHIIWLLGVVTFGMSYISGHIVFTGYAPKFLPFTHGAKDGL